MTIFQALVLGLIQGLTEFFPVSSSAHMVLFPWLVGWNRPGVDLDLALHAGAFAALLVYFFSDWTRLLTAGLAVILERRVGFDRDRQVAMYLLLAMIPGIVIGFLVQEYADTAQASPLLVAVALAFLGFLLYWVDGRAGSLRSIEELGQKDAFWIGMAQAASVFPGISSAGSAITMGRFLGFARDAAARFAFLLAIPVLFGAIIFKFDDVIHLAQSTSLAWGPLVVSFFAAFFSGIAAIHFLLSHVRNGDFRMFAWYRLVLAVFVILFSVFSGR